MADKAIKVTESNDAEDLRAEYLASDPIDLPEATLKKASELFGVPLDEVKNIVKGMHNARQEVIKNDIY